MRGPQAEVGEDLLDHLRLLDEGDDPHCSRTAGAHEGVYFVDLLDQASARASRLSSTNSQPSGEPRRASRQRRRKCWTSIARADEGHPPCRRGPGGLPVRDLSQWQGPNLTLPFALLAAFHHESAKWRVGYCWTISSAVGHSANRVRGMGSESMATAGSCRGRETNLQGGPARDGTEAQFLLSSKSHAFP